MMAAILNSDIMDSAIFLKTLTKTNSFWLKLIHSDSIWWWQPSWILPCWIQTLPPWIETLFYLLSDLLKNTLSPLWLWFKLIQSDSNSFILTQLDDGSHLEFCHVGFSHLSFSSQTHLHLPRLVPNICTKKLHSFILTQLDDGSYLELCHHGFSHLAQRKLHSFILTQLDDGSYLEICHFGFSHFSTKKNLHSFILTQLDDGSHLEFCHV